MSAEHLRQLGGESPLDNLMEVKSWRSARAFPGDRGSERSVERTYEPMDKNRIGGIRCRASGQLTATSISIKGTGCKSGGCAPKAVALASGDLPFVRQPGLRIERSILNGRRKSPGAGGYPGARRTPKDPPASGQENPRREGGRHDSTFDSNAAPWIRAGWVAGTGSGAAESAFQRR